MNRIIIINLLSTIGAILCMNLPGIEKFDKVRINEKNYDFVKNLHGNWYATGLKALMGKLGRNLYQKISKSQQSDLAICLDRIEDKRDLVFSAQCLVRSRNNYQKVINGRSIDLNEEINANLAYGRRIRGKISNGDLLKSENLQWAKRLRNIHGKIHLENSQKAYKKKIDQNVKFPKYKIKQAQTLDKLPSRADRSAIANMAYLIAKLVGKDEISDMKRGKKWTEMYETLVRLKNENDLKRKAPGARVYEMRMYDLVLGYDEPTLAPKEKKSGSGLLKMGLRLLDKLRNSSSSSSGSNYKLMSPRFAPLMPEAGSTVSDDSDKRVLSPTVFALYDIGEDQNSTDQQQKDSLESALSIPQLLKSFGLDKADSDTLLQSLLEMSGSIGHIQKAMEMLKSLNFFEIEPDLASATNRITNAFERVEQTFNAEQRREMDSEGWTFLRQSQFDQLCTDQRTQFPENFQPKNFDELANLPKEMREASIWKRIERIARNISDEIADKIDSRKWEKLAFLHPMEENKRRRRKRRQIIRQRQPPAGTNIPPFPNGMTVLQPVILQPFMFSPALTPSVWGPLVLSPNLFSPFVLAPSAGSPFVLSPAAPMPMVLSPYVLGPFILSPMALAPFILTPYVLSPNILNPYALSPLILSPTVLSPDILSPQVLGGAILSPSVGSPAILTETHLMASVLSPTVLS